MKSQIRPQAGLQRRVLFALAAGQVPNVVTLAARVGAARPSVSRSLKGLLAKELVSREGRRWSIAPAGRILISQSGGLPLGVQRAVSRHANLQRQFGIAVSQTTRSNQAATEWINGFAKMNLAVTPAFKSTLDEIAKMNLAVTPAFKSTLDEIGLLTKARADVFDSMSLQFAALAQPPAWWSSMIADNLSMTSRVAADVAAITDALALPWRLGPSSMRRLHIGIEQVVAAHHSLLESSLPGLLRSEADAGAAGVVVTPTTTTAAYTRVSRGVVLPEASADTTDLLTGAVEELALRLNDAGAHAAARDLRAAMDVLRRRQAGWPKTGAHLLREVLREALDELAPREVVPPDRDGRVTKRAQVTWMVGGDRTLGLWIDVTSGNVGKLHSLLSAEAKNNGSPRLGHQGLIGLLEVVMGLIRTMVEQVARH